MLLIQTENEGMQWLVNTWLKPTRNEGMQWLVNELITKN